MPEAWLDNWNSIRYKAMDDGRNRHSSVSKLGVLDLKCNMVATFEFGRKFHVGRVSLVAGSGLKLGGLYGFHELHILDGGLTQFGP